ncbi:serine hydrolase domain-containing protein [Tenacibaculum sp. C7A-26P2]|uniref:serine hydrolase domain-containing protein n=1 Tax=Tenacibaculum sp. C7A-26P2 TaxID=3447504 RepID=UPI003F8768E8
MKQYKLNILFLILLFSFDCIAQNQIVGVSGDSGISVSGKKIAEILSFYPEDQPGGTFIATINGEIIASAALGKSNLELDVDMKMNNVFNIASVTKPFTAVSIFTLIEKGKIGLDDKVLKFIPDFPEEGKDITIGHLLSHSSGMEYKNDEKERDDFKRAIKMKRSNDSVSVVKYFTKEKFDTEPGNNHNYNNVAYQLLGYIIEIVSGKSYEDYLKETFFEPLNMKNTVLESSIKVINNRATGYDSFNGKDYQIRKIDSDDSYFYSAGGLMSTVEDLSIWYTALMNYKIISETNLKKLITPITYNDGTYGANGYGVFTGNLNGNNFVLHDGLGWGYGSIILYFPKQKLFIAHLRNCGYCKYDIGQFYNAPIRIAAILLDSEYSKDYNQNAPLKKYIGTFTSTLSQEDKIIIEKENKLFINNSRFGLLQLNLISENTFFVERTNETLVFNKIDKNNVELISNRGIPIVFKKAEK